MGSDLIIDSARTNHAWEWVAVFAFERSEYANTGTLPCGEQIYHTQPIAYNIY